MNMRQELTRAGFFKFEENILAYRDRVLVDFHNPSALAASHITIFPSLLSADASSKFQPKALVLDIGGSSTKAALRIYDKLDSIVSWTFLFEVKNSELKTSSGSFASFCDSVVKRISEKLSQLIMSQHDIKALGIVWSNPMQSHLLPHLGVNGHVCSRAQYNKNEWFISDMKDGDDIGAAFLRAFEAKDMHISALVVSNDVPLTMKAHSGANAGVVVSTGANGTLVQAVKDSAAGFKRSIYNAELGKNLKVPAEYLTAVDKSFGDERGVPIEYLIAGKFLGDLFQRYIVYFGSHGFERFARFADKLRDMGDKANSFFAAIDLAGLVNHHAPTIRALGPFASDASLVDALTELATALLVRAAKIASVLVFASVANQLEDRGNLSVALDSRLSREIPLFWEVLSNQIAQLTGTSRTIKLHLLQPLETERGTVSVPMLGAAAALDNLCK